MFKSNDSGLSNDTNLLGVGNNRIISFLVMDSSRIQSVFDKSYILEVCELHYVFFFFVAEIPVTMRNCSTFTVGLDGKHDN